MYYNILTSVNVQLPKYLHINYLHINLETIEDWIGQWKCSNFTDETKLKGVEITNYKELKM